VIFPHYFHVFGRPLHPHPVMEVVAYTGGFQLYLYLRRRHARLRPHDPLLPFEQNVWLIVGAIFGALAGSKLLAWLESPLDYFAHLDHPQVLLGGKTIVGGLLGGWIGVEIAKRALGIRRSTGDLFVFPLIFGMAVGRVGCFLTGLDDHTCGNHTSVPWAVNFGDGPRHPAQLYDVVFLMILASALFLYSRHSPAKFSRRACPPCPDGSPAQAPGHGSQASRLNGARPPAGVLFRLFMLAYLAYRFGVEFLKPRYHPYLGLSAIQWAAVIGAAVCMVSLRKIKSASGR
jgi:prolipoprotein diacylglyceryltransferase